MATFIKVSSSEEQLLRRNRDQVQGNRLQKVETDEQAATGKVITAAVGQQQVAALAGGRRQTRLRRDEPAASLIALVKADYYVIRYEFNTGQDLDTRTYLVNPLTLEQLGPVGWCKNSTISVNEVPVVTWGGDNTGTGVESVLLDRQAYEEQFPDADPPVLSLNAFWYSKKGSSVTLSITGFLGGAMVVDEQNFTWINPTAKRSWNKFATFTSQAVQTNVQQCINGDYIVKLKIDYARGNVTWIP